MAHRAAARIHSQPIIRTGELRRQASGILPLRQRRRRFLQLRHLFKIVLCGVAATIHLTVAAISDAKHQRPTNSKGTSQEHCTHHVRRFRHSRDKEYSRRFLAPGH
jgi:hypothetical protein